MEYGRPITEPEIEEERKKIITLVKQLEAAGRIFIREKPKTDMLEGIEDGAQQGTAEAGAAGYDEYFNAGVQSYEAGQYEEALQYFEYCVQLDPANAGLYQYLGNTYYGLGRLQEAIPYYEKALELNPEDQGLRAWLSEQKNTIS
jgi:tetratricopeptide (TPR) repeat protein